MILDAASLISVLRSQGIKDPATLAAIEAVPREAFVPRHLQHLAFANRALPIGLDQTISQPWIVARMTELAALAPGDRVLEIGTGSGYQTAVLCELDAEVFSLEVWQAHSDTAGKRLADLGYHPSLAVRDGWHGWPERAPFDCIVVTAAPERVPPDLLDQVVVGGRIVLPVGPQDGRQVLTVVVKEADGGFSKTEHVGVTFVPMVHGV